MAKAANATVSEALGVVLLGAGILLLLALVSFDPGNVPSWVFFTKIVPANAHPSNFIGIVGVLGVGLLYFSPRSGSVSSRRACSSPAGFPSVA